MGQWMGKKVLVVLAVGIMLVAAGCDLALVQGRTGSLAISIDSAARNLVWEPGLDMDIASCTVRGAGPTANDVFEVTGHTGGLFTRDSLAVGSWTITVDGYNAGGDKVAAAEATAAIVRNATTPVAMVLRPLAGTGTLSVGVSWTDSQGVLADPGATVEIRDEEGADIETLSDPVALTVDGHAATGEVAGLPAGWYEVTVSLCDGSATAWQGVFALRIVEGQTTTGTVAITEDQLQVGHGSGNVSIVIEEDMDSPLVVGFTGLAETVEAGTEVTLSSTETYSGSEQYRWYVNGVRQAGQAAPGFAYTFDEVGTHTVSLLVLDGGALGGYGESVVVTDEQTLSFDANGGTGSMSAVALDTGEVANLPANTFTKAGYTFAGWATTSGGVVAYANQASYTMGSADQTLYAKWTADEQTLSFDANGGTGSMSAVALDTDEVADLTANTFAKAGYTFAGWATTSGGVVAYADEASYTMGSEDQTLYAKWTADEQTSEYTVGDLGPSGGYVFYENPSHATDGWRYLEAAPASTEWTGKEWGGYGTGVGGTGTTIGTGESNTGKIVAKYGNAEPRAGKTDYAAKLCADLVVTKDSVVYDDWFLPSKDELNQMRQVLYVNSLGGFSDTTLSWSSSEYSSTSAWLQYFGTGAQDGNLKYVSCRVRAVRAF